MKSFAIFSSFFLAAMTAGCGGSKSANYGNTLIYGRGGDAETLDPIHTDVGETVMVLQNIYDTLVTYADDSLEIVPALATEWESSDDGRTWTFHLRKGVKFHDGSDFNADAVVFSFERILDPDHPHAHGSLVPFRPTFAAIEKVEAVDPYTVVFHLHEPDAVFLENLCMYAAMIVSPAAVKERGSDYTNNPSGTGPFHFVSWSRDREIVLAANDDYWRGRPKIDRAIFLVVGEPSVRVKQLRRGGIHIADNLPPREIDKIEDADIKVQEQPGINVGYITMQTEKPPFDNLIVREAIWHAIDKKRLIEQCYAGHARPAASMMPPTLWAYDEGIVDRKYDPQKAKQLLEEATKESGFSLPLKVELMVMDTPRPYMQQPRETAVLLKEMLAAVGIEVSIVTNPIAQHFQRLSRGEHQLAVSGWSSDNNDPDNFLYQLLHSDNMHEGGNNLSRYRSPQFDALVSQARRELDREKRRELYHQAQAILFADAPTVPLVHTSVRLAVRKEVGGYHLHPGSLVRLRTAYFEKGDK